jgi:hypothetical protein
MTAIWYLLRQFGKLVAIWYIFTRFGILCQEKSGNPGRIIGIGWVFECSRENLSKKGTTNGWDSPYTSIPTMFPVLFWVFYILSKLSSISTQTLTNCEWALNSCQNFHLLLLTKQFHHLNTDFVVCM